MRIPSDLERTATTPSLANIFFEKLPYELISYVSSYLNLKDYVSFASVSKNHLQLLTHDSSLKFYDPTLATILVVSTHFIKEVFDEKIENVQQTVSSKLPAPDMSNEAPAALSRKGLSDRGKIINQLQLIQALPQDKTWDFGMAIDNGDCFYDTIAQSLNARTTNGTHTLKSLRKICSDYIYQLNAQSPQANWVKAAIEKDKGIDDYQTHLTSVQFTQEEMARLKQESNVLIGYAIWGKPHIEGKILAQQLNISLHIIEFHEAGSGMEAVEPTHILVTKDKVTQVEKESIHYQDEQMLHLAVYRNHFVPILPSQYLKQQQSHLEDRKQEMTQPNKHSQKIENNFVQLKVIKEMEVFYKEIKSKVLATEIGLNENMLIKMLDCYLSAMDNEAKNKLKFNFLNKLFDDYFKLRTHIIFDATKTDFPVFADHVKLNYLMTCIDSVTDTAFFKGFLSNDNFPRIVQSPVMYFYAQSRFFLFLYANDLSIDNRKKALLLQKKCCYESYRAGAKSAVFLQLCIYYHQKLKQFEPEIPPKVIGKLAREAVKLLGIPEISNEMHLFEKLGLQNLQFLSIATAKSIKMLKKLLKNNPLASLKTLDLKIWKILVKGEHSLEFLNAFNGNIEFLKALCHLVNSQTQLVLLQEVCDSPNADLLCQLWQQEISSSQFEQNKDRPIITTIRLSRGDLLHLASLKKYYPQLLIGELLPANKYISFLLSQSIDKKKLLLLISKVEFSLLEKISEIIFFNREYFSKSLESFFEFLISDDGTDLLQDFGTMDFYPLKYARSKNKKADVLDDENSQYLDLKLHYKYFRKAGIFMQNILQMAKWKMAIIKDWLAMYEYLFEKWTGEEIKNFIKLMCLKGSDAPPIRKKNVRVFKTMQTLPQLLRNSQGEVIAYKDFYDLIESEVVLHMQSHTCKLLYEKLGLEPLKMCSDIQIIVNNFPTNLLQTLSNLNVEQVDKILTDAKGDIEYLKQSVTQSTKPADAQPMELSVHALHSSSSGFFSQSHHTEFQAASQKRSHARMLIEELEMLIVRAKQAQAEGNEQKTQEIFNKIHELTDNTTSKAPKFSNSKAEEN